MTGRERILTALDLKEPDMVPVWEQAFNEPSIIGIARYFVEDSSKLPEPKLVMDMTDQEKFQLISALLTLIRELDLDGATATSLAPRKRLEQDYIQDSLGVIYRLSQVGEPYPTNGPVKEPGDLKGFKIRSPVPEDFLMLEILRSTFPDKAITYHMPCSFKVSWLLLGSLEKLLMNYILNPNFVKELAKISTEYCLALIEIALQKGADFIILEGDLAHNPGPMMNPAHYDEFILPYHYEICQKVHKLGGKVVKHSDGNITPLIPSLIQAGFDGIHPIQPQCMDIAQTKENFGDKLCLLGNIDCAYLLVFGTPEQVEMEVGETIKKAGTNGGYILSSSNSIHPGCKPENYLALVRSARKYGKYPLKTSN